MAEEPTFKRRDRLAVLLASLRRVIALPDLSAPVIEELRGRETQVLADLTQARADYRAELEGCPYCKEGKLVPQWSGCTCDRCSASICF